MPSERWLITGASGQLGGHLLHELLRDVPTADICALAGTQPVAGPPAHVHHVDLADLDTLRQLTRAFAPTHVVHLGALTAVGACQADPARARLINVDSTRTLHAAAADCHAHFTLASTDMVFDGDHAPYREDDVPRPLSEYGRSKLAAEQAIAGADQTLIVRPPLMYGLPVTPRATTFVKQLDALRRGEPLTLFVDEFRTPAWLADVARAIVGLARAAITGTMHVGGPERLSRYDLIARCAALLGCNQANLIESSRLDIEAPEPRPADLSLDSTQLRRQFPHLAPGELRTETITPHQN